jgi:hypothetical protein
MLRALPFAHGCDLLQRGNAYNPLHLVIGAGWAAFSNVYKIARVAVPSPGTRPYLRNTTSGW